MGVDLSKVDYTGGVEFDIMKLRALILMILERVGCASISMETLHHLLFLCDFESYARFGKGITGSTYVKREWGIENKELAAVLKDMDRAGEIDLSKIPWEKELNMTSKLESIPVVGYQTMIVIPGLDGIWEIQLHDTSGTLERGTGKTLEEAVDALFDVVELNGRKVYGA